MKLLFKPLLDYLVEWRLVRCDQYATPVTPKNQLLSLIKSLHPDNSSAELIRLGPKGDGGYLVPDDLKNIEACFSPGVNTESGFEHDCANLGMKVFMADKSVECPASKHDLFHFTKKYIGSISNEDYITLDEWVSTSLSSTDSDLLLQIDIEGYEYETFASISAPLMSRFRMIVAEFHDLDQLWSKPFYNFASRTIEKILQTHACVHIHPNNCCGSTSKNNIEIPKVCEFTFARRDRLGNSQYEIKIPNPLDFDNTNKDALSLQDCWYK